MKVRHERPQSDLGFEATAPLKLTHPSGRVTTIRQWNLKGGTFPDDIDIMPSNVIISIPFQGVEVSFDAKLEPNPEKKNSFRFKELGGRERETLAVFYRSLLSGRMVNTDEIITSLDTPVDLVPMGETDEEEAVGTKDISSRKQRIVWNSVFYAIFAFVVFGLVGTSIYQRIAVIELQNGRIQAPMIELRASEPAFIHRIHVEVGDRVDTGDLLIELNSPERDVALDAVRIEIRSVERKIAENEDALELARERRALFRQRLFEMYEAERIQRPFADYFAGKDLDPVTRRWIDLQDFETLRSPIAIEFENTLYQLEVALEESRNELQMLKRELSNRKDASDANNILAAAPGIVREIPVYENLYAARGQLGIVLEENRPRVVVGWLNEAQSTSVHIGQSAKVRISGLEGARSFDAEIVDAVAGVDPVRPSEFGVLVTLAVDDVDVEASRDMLRPDAPAQIRVDRGWWLTPFVSALRSWF